MVTDPTPHKAEIILHVHISLVPCETRGYQLRVEQATAPDNPAPPLRIDAGVPTLAHLRDEWLMGMEISDCSPIYRRDAKRVINELLESGCLTFPGQLTDTAITAWLARKKLLVAASTLKNLRGVISSFCTFLMDKGVFERSPVDAVATPQVYSKRARLVPTEEQVRALIIASNSDWRKKHRWLLYLLAASTTLRRGALLGLTWDMVFETADPPRLELPPQLVKNRREQLTWLTHEAATWLGVARSKTGGKGRVFPMKQESEQFERDRIAAGLDKRIVQGGPTLAFHSLRHFAVTRMKAAELISDSERQKQAGHRTPAMTTNIYTDDASVMLGKKIFSMHPLLPQGFMPVWGRNRVQSFDKVDTNADDVPATSHRSNANLHKHNSRLEEPPCLAERCCPALDRRGVLQHAQSARLEQASRLTSQKRGDRFESCHPDSIARTPLLVDLVRVQSRLIDLLLKELVHDQSPGSASTVVL